MSFSHQAKLVRVSKLFVTVAAVATIAACSTDVDRLADYPPVKQTGSLPKNNAPQPVTAKPLDNASVPRTTPSWQTGYKPQQPAAPAYQPTTQPGTLTVQRGQTLYSIARANGTTVGSLAAANNLHAPYSVKVGQRLVIPGNSNPVSPAPSFQPLAANAPAPAARPNYASANGTHKVRAGETLFAVGRAYNMSPFKIAAHNNLPKPYHLNAGQVLRIPGAGSSQPAWKAPAKKVVYADQPQPRRKQTYQRIDDTPKPVPVEPVVKKQPTQQPVAGGFRWPVKGRVISTFGSKPNGTRNEGINIAVPEGASVRSAESGVVAYSGNELKGYGNLVLIRHENGWVSAYAHNSEVFVRRGDTVKRGEVIAKAGSTGSVSSPQLHFELRKGASAVDPMKYLNRQTASN